MNEHREAAEHALAHAQLNPIMSAEQSFAVAQIQALLAIEQRLSELMGHLRARTTHEIVPSDAS